MSTEVQNTDAAQHDVKLNVERRPFTSEQLESLERLHYLQQFGENSNMTKAQWLEYLRLRPNAEKWLGL
jgi:hypothetical protein